MHIPDGFLAPQTYLPAWALAMAAWGWATRQLRHEIDETTLPRLAMLTALSYALSLVMLPLPSGTSGHALGVALITLLFGVRLAFLSYSLVLLLQALLFAAGGITALAVNALAIGLAGSATAVAIHRLLRRWHETAAVALAAWGSVMVAAVLIGLTLGLQPLIASDEAGRPLYFPFSFVIVLPAVLLPHAMIGVGEALLTVLVWRYTRARGWLPATP